MRLPGLFTAALIIACLGPTYTYGQNSDQHRSAESTEPYHKHRDIRHGHDHFYPDRGSVVRDLPAGTIGVNYAGASYRYHDGVWLEPRGPAFVVVAPPIGLVVPTLPTFTTILARNGETYLYCNDTYYRPRPDLGGYEVINDPTNTAPQAGPDSFVGGQVPGGYGQSASGGAAPQVAAVSSTSPPSATTTPVPGLAATAALPMAAAVVPIGTAPSVTAPTATAMAVPASAVAPLPITTTAALASPGATLPSATALGATTSGAAAHATNLLGAIPTGSAAPGATPIAATSLGATPPGGATLGSSTSLVAASSGAPPSATPPSATPLGTTPLGSTPPPAPSPAVGPVAPAAAPATTPSITPPKGPKVFVYPRNGQNADQQARDRYDCYRFAVGQSGFDPMHTAGGTTAPNIELQSDYDRAQAACFDARGYTIR